MRSPVVSYSLRGRACSVDGGVLGPEFGLALCCCLGAGWVGLGLYVWGGWG